MTAPLVHLLETLSGWLNYDFSIKLVIQEHDREKIELAWGNEKSVVA